MSLTPEELSAIAAEVAQRLVESAPQPPTPTTTALGIPTPTQYMPGYGAIGQNGVPLPPTNAMEAGISPEELRYRQGMAAVKDPYLRTQIHPGELNWLFDQAYKRGINRHGRKLRHMTEFMNSLDKD